MTTPIRVAMDGAVAVVTLDRPGVLNAVDACLRDALIVALGTLNRDDRVGAVVITGAGERAFSAGQDLAEARRFGSDDLPAWLAHQRAMYQAVRDLDKPAVAAMTGVAAGAGFQIALCADLRVGHAELRIGQPEIRAGLASIVGSYLMTEQIGLGHNRELSLTGSLISGTRAYEIGLLNRLVPREDVLSCAIDLAQDLAAQPRTAMRLTKQQFRRLTQPAFDAACDAALAAQREAYRSGEPQRAMASFLDRKRSAG